MNKANHVLKAALAAAGLVGAVTMSALPVIAVAQDPKPPKLNAKVQKALAAQEAIQAKDWAKATTDLDTARAVEGKSPYDEFMISERAASFSSTRRTMPRPRPASRRRSSRAMCRKRIFRSATRCSRSSTSRRRTTPRRSSTATSIRECPDGPGDRRPGSAGLFSAEGLCERPQHGEESHRRLAQADRADPAGDAGEQSGAR